MNFNLGSVSRMAFNFASLSVRSLEGDGRRAPGIYCKYHQSKHWHAEHARVIFSAGWVEMRHFVCLLLPFL